jgi:hypothetical protein
MYRSSNAIETACSKSSALRSRRRSAAISQAQQARRSKRAALMSRSVPDKPTILRIATCSLGKRPVRVQLLRIRTPAQVPTSFVIKTSALLARHSCCGGQRLKLRQRLVKVMNGSRIQVHQIELAAADCHHSTAAPFDLVRRDILIVKLYAIVTGRDLALTVCDFGRYANVTNLVSQCARFLLTRA